MGSLRATIVPATSLTPTDLDAMFGVFERYYADVTRDRFEYDLSSKDDVIVLRDREHGVIRGFSTLRRMEFDVGGQIHRGIFSGDTVIDRDYWGGSSLGRAFTMYLVREWARNAGAPLWWFLISKGFKTYLLMANNFPEHYPRFEKPTPPDVQAIMDSFAHECFGEAYVRELGILRFAECMGRVRDGVATITPEMCAEHPRIAFFQARNPAWNKGDELVCVARLTPTMPAGYLLKKLVAPLRKALFGRRKPRAVTVQPAGAAASK